MIKISLVVPDKGFIENAASIFKEHNDYENIQNTPDNKEEYILEEIIVKSPHSAKSLNLNADVIITRGILAETVKSQFPDIPVVELPVVGNDLIRSLYESKLKYGKRKTAVIGSLNMIFAAESLSEIVDLDVKSYFMKSDESDRADLVEKAFQEGCEVIIGGIITYGYCGDKGLNAVLIKTGKESFWQAITEAKRVAHVSIKEQEKNQRFKTILDYANEGIIAVDNNFNISVFNSAAQKTLAINEKDVIDRKIKDIIDDKRLMEIIKDSREYLEEIIKYKDIQLTLNKGNIMLKSHKVGSVIALQDVTSVQVMEGKIRKKIYNKGHYAKYTFDDIVGKSKAIKQTIQMAQRFSKVDTNVLILGETGTGKELFAQSIHNSSRRQNGPFVAINCAALPESLLESELFGYVEGAFTGANKAGKPGIFELAHTGTIFLDEIGEIPIKLQARLLRVLQEKEIMRLGDDKVIPIDVRVISATNKNLFKLTNSGSFREDLYYRLDILSLHLPSLREKKEDIPLLVDSFIDAYVQQNRRNRITVTEHANRLLQKYDWPGNIRELRNVLERLVVLSRNDVIEAADVEEILSHIMQMRRCLTEEDNNSYKELVHNQEVEYKNAEIERIQRALREANFIKGEAAKLLGVNRTTLWRQMKQFGIR